MSCIVKFVLHTKHIYADIFSDDQEFPPLASPMRLQERLPATKSHIHSVQGSLDPPIRSSTPRIPPGLSLPHAHPSPSFSEDVEIKTKETKPPSNVTGPVVPALPILPIGHRPTNPREKVVATPVASQPAEDRKDVAVPNSEKNRISAEEKVDAVLETIARTININPRSTIMQPSGVQDISKNTSKTGSAPKHDAIGNSDKQSHSQETTAITPQKLDISAALAQKPKLGVSTSTTNPQVLSQSMVATPVTIESFPSTPSAHTVKSPDWTSAGRPRTLRLTTTTTPKAEAALSPAVTERSSTLSVAVRKRTSRQPSLSSISRSRPSTPTISEHGTSTEISRAGSPPPSDIVGSAPEKNKSKSQAKKERRAKPKTTTDTKGEESAVSTPTIAEEVGPIISRQKKKKRTQEKSSQISPDVESADTSNPEPTDVSPAEKTSKTESRKSTKETSSISSQDRPLADARKPSIKARPGKGKSEKGNTRAASKEKNNQGLPEGSAKKAYTLNDLLNDAANLPETEHALSELLNASISATSTLLQELFASKEIDINSALFNTPPLTSYKLPPQPYRGADYLDANGYTMNSPFGEIYLSGSDRKQLLHGRDVRLSDPNKPQNVLKRNMITPTGAIFRHLSVEEEQKVIELEKRTQENEERYGVTGKGELKPLDDMDFMNLTGGLQELMAFPPLHRISLLTSAPGTEGAEDDEAGLGGNGSDETEDEMAPLASGFGAAPEGSMRKPMTPATMKRKAEALMAVNLRNLDVDKLQKRIRETQIDMEGARKEMEALEKKAAKKAKDVARWREALLKEIGRGM